MSSSPSERGHLCPKETECTPQRSSSTVSARNSVGTSCCCSTVLRAENPGIRFYETHPVLLFCCYIFPPPRISDSRGLRKSLEHPDSISRELCFWRWNAAEHPPNRFLRLKVIHLHSEAIKPEIEKFKTGILIDFWHISLKARMTIQSVMRPAETVMGKKTIDFRRYPVIYREQTRPQRKSLVSSF
jgi:hypothetical protein